MKTSIIDKIGKSIEDFNFVESLGSFINNSQFKSGFCQSQAISSDTKDTYIWHALSSIGEGYGEVIYENVINYIDNAANVDVCKIKALQSMMKIVGIKYDVLDAFSHIPVEIAKLMDLLSINRKYLLDSKTFRSDFIDELKARGVILSADPTASELSSMLLSSEYSRVHDDAWYVDEDAYANFLYQVYNTVLTDFVYMKYADAEAGLSTMHEYIYEYIQSDILAGQQVADSYQQTPYQKKIAALKLQYSISKSFDQIAIVDAIEDGYDSYENYNIYQQQILDYEIRRRQETYSYLKTYLSSDNEVSEGLNLTRYSYYREKKVKEYFKFIEDTYNNLIVEESIKNAIENDVQVTISQYKPDINYFDVDQSVKKHLLAYDDLADDIYLQTEQIQAITQLLVQQTLMIANIRDQVKTQIRKSYMRGTFLLISYVINEFLKYNIAEKYGDSFQTEDTNVKLGTILNQSIENGNNVELIEYYDPTEYFNISCESAIHAKYGNTVNNLFWDNIYDKIGKVTHDLPLHEIEKFYLEQLKLKRNNVDDVVNFLSILYEYGANNSYIDNATDEYTCLIPGREVNDPPTYIGDPYKRISAIESDISSIHSIVDEINSYIEVGAYNQTIDVIMSQLSSLCVDVSSYYYKQISDANEQTKEDTLDQICSDLEYSLDINSKLEDISASYMSLLNDKKYSYYLSDYNELSNAYFIEKVHYFKLSATEPNGIDWHNKQLQIDLPNFLDEYKQLSNNVFNKLFALSVWPVDAIKKPSSASGDKYYNVQTTYWPFYSPKYDNELTTITNDLKNFLVEQAQVQEDSAMQHLQNHYDNLLRYSNDLVKLLTDCNGAIAKYEAMYAAIEAVSMTKMTDEYICCWVVNSGPIQKVKYDKTLHEYVDDGVLNYQATEDVYVNSPAIDDSDTITVKLDALAKRSQVRIYTKPQSGIALKQDTKYRYPTGDGIAAAFSERKPHENTYTIDDITYTEIYYTYIYWPNVGMLWFDKDAYTQPWSGAYSASTASDIKATLSNAVDELNAIVTAIDSDLNCLGGTFMPIGPYSSTIDSVRDDASEAYNALVERLSALNTYIFSTGWQSLTSDQNLVPFINRLKTISYINLSTAEPYNIQYIDNRFQALQLSVQQALANNSEYFDMYVNNDADRLDKQILAMSAYILERDTQASVDVLSTINKLSSDYIMSLNDFKMHSLMLNYKVVDSVNDDYSYNLSMVMYQDDIWKWILNATPPYHPAGGDGWPIRMQDCLDYILCGNYIDDPYDEQLSGVLYWLPRGVQKFENSAASQTRDKVPFLTSYINTIELIDLAASKYAKYVKDEDMLLVDKLDAIVSELEEDITYISSKIPFYDESHEIYLKYNGTEIGYDPFYCYKNMAYSSYQIHPYLYNFVEKSKLIYPLANNFFVSFMENYETDLVLNGIDNILGEYGNIKNLWKSGLYDWTSYQSKYEHRGNAGKFTIGTINPNDGFTGLFYPPAIKAFIDDPNKFLQDVQDDNKDSYYHHLNLPENQCQKIYQQLLAYQPMIKYVATAQGTFALSGEYDIYKYAEDCMGNSIFLLKSYRHLYEQHKDDPDYHPSYHEKRNTLGELWMRVKDHPLAFPAIDLREGYADISQYSIKKTANSLAEDINSYVKHLNQYFRGLEGSSDTDVLSTATLTRDTIGQYQLGQIVDIPSYDLIESSKAQHLKCFFDIETDVLNQTLLLVVPFKTGDKWQNIYYDVASDPEHLNPIIQLKYQNIRYADSSIVISYLGDHVLFNSMTDQTYVYLFKTDVYTENNQNIDNIPNNQMLVNGSLSPFAKTNTYYIEFVGFAKNGLFIYAVFVKKYFVFGPSIKENAFTFVHNNYKKTHKPALEIEYFGYKCHLLLDKQKAYSDNLMYDAYDWRQDTDQYPQTGVPMSSYANASNIALASGNGQLTIGFLTQRIQTKASDYGNNTQIVNFTEYSSQLESYNAMSATGENLEYPKSTALLQTTDSAHVNIYNSFDSFTQHLVNVTFNFLGNMLDYESTKYFNLNSDIGYFPQYANKEGISYYGQNTALKNAQQYSIELLGPEKTDIDFTPTIDISQDEKYGRVTEDYHEINKISALNLAEILMSARSKVATYTFDLSSVFIANFETASHISHKKAVDEWTYMLDTPDLLKYKYVLYNTEYLAMPILKGNLSDLLPNGYYYNGSEKYDMLSGEDVIGPNQTTYQNIDMTNHIDNIQQICANVEFNADAIPSAITLSCIAREAPLSNQYLLSGTFFVLLYLKNNLLSYKYHHLFENANKNITSTLSNIMSSDQEWGIDLSKDVGGIENISVEAYDGNILYPFRKSPDSVGKKYYQLSAPLEFKYSEEYQEYINSEFPNIDPIDVEDEITIVQNDSQSIYYFSINDYSAIDLDTFKMKVYDPSLSSSYLMKINPILPKYKDFYSHALVIEATYNLEETFEGSKKYEIVQYFNYKNFTNPQYVKIDWSSGDKVPPDAHVCDSTDPSIKNTYLVLKPGQSGRLDLRVDFVFYDKIKSSSISYSIVGVHSQIIKSYYIMNVSDEKPKFIISRNPFMAVEDYIDEEDNYEVESKIYPGVAFRYVMMVISMTRNTGSTSPLANCVALSYIKFFAKDDPSKVFAYPSKTTVTIQDGISDPTHLIVYPNVPSNLLDPDLGNEFFASDLKLFTGHPLSIIIDMKDAALDVSQYQKWSWYNSSVSNYHSGYIPKNFYVAFSNDMEKWYVGDSFNDVHNSIPTTNSGLAYTGTIDVMTS